MSAPRRHGHLMLAGEVALALVTVAAIVGMHRLFEDGSYRGPLVAQAIVAHATVTLLRRAGLRLGPAALATAATAVLVVTWACFPDTTRWLLPTATTFDHLGRDLAHAWELFGDVRAPAPVENGFIAATAGAVWLLVFVADWAAFRAAATFEALLPAATLFLFAAALGGPGSPVASAAVFSAAALGHVLLHRTANQERTARWAGEHRSRGRWSLVGTGAALTGVAVVAGAVAGPQLPGADGDPVLAWRAIAEDEPTRRVLSPMVSLQTRLVELPEVEVFTVRSERSSYWRLTSLDEFDGEIWRSSYSTDDASGELPRAFDIESETETVTQEITIEALSSVWLPAAYQPVAIDPGDRAADYDERSSTLMVDRDVPTSDGYTYTVTSAIPEWDPESLRTASDDIPDGIADTYLQLPDGFPDGVRAEADRLTRDRSTAYDKALALQQHLRTFTYDQTVGPGHSQDALMSFLFETRRGYCEQFSGAFAALARAAGIPARVAVGFTPGVQDPHDPTLFRVRGVHAHAWPEVYLGEHGWVPFEPTPDRGPPRPSHLGIEERQDTSTGGEAVTDDTAADGPAAAGDGARPGGPAPETGQGLDLGGAGAPSEIHDADDGVPVLPAAVRDAGRPLALGGLGYLLLAPVAVVGWRVARRRRARTPAARVRLRWREATERAVAAGIALPHHLTVAEMADRLSDALPGSRDAIQHLARSMEALHYGGTPPSAAEVAAAERAWAAVAAEASGRRHWARRVLDLFDIRQVFTARRARQAAREAPVSSLA